MIVAIDGPAGAGKSTTACRVAQQLGFAYVDTGAMYRALALLAHEKAIELDNEANLEVLAGSIPFRFEGDGTSLMVGNRDLSAAIRTPEIGSMASQVAALPAVRSVVVARQQELARVAEAECGGAVLEGRDIQTVVFPDAGVKIFLTASAQVRAQRRLGQWTEGGQAGDMSRAEQDVLERDARDMGRASSPLLAAPDAVHISTDDYGPEAVVAMIVELAREKMK